MNGTSVIVTDRIYQKKERYNSFEQVVVKLLNDERDLPIVYTCLKASATAIPIGIILFIPGVFSWWFAVPYFFLNMLVFLPPVVLMTHSTSHRPLFKQEYAYLNNYIPWVIGPFYGLSPNTFFAHHIGMHHVENNLEKDLNCTMIYQRDSIIDFCKYFFTFFFFGIFTLPSYLFQKRRPILAKKMLIGEFDFMVLCAILLFFNWQATLMVFILPFLVVRFTMMAGNWGEHAFVDGSDAGNFYRNSVTNINCKHNRICFNNGYHIGHHIRPSMHWTELPLEFINNMDKYAAESPVVFKGLDSVLVWFHLMIKNYTFLSKRFIDVGNKFHNRAEIILFLKERVKKIA